MLGSVAGFLYAGQNPLQREKEPESHGYMCSVSRHGAASYWGSIWAYTAPVNSLRCYQDAIEFAGHKTLTCSALLHNRGLWASTFDLSALECRWYDNAALVMEYYMPVPHNSVDVAGVANVLVIH